MIVKQIGYKKLKDILQWKSEGKVFSIYKTRKNTLILVLNSKVEEIHLFYPKYDRIPYKEVEGKKIINGIKIYSNKTEKITTEGWNNNEQIMCYEAFDITIYY